MILDVIQTNRCAFIRLKSGSFSGVTFDGKTPESTHFSRDGWLKLDVLAKPGKVLRRVAIPLGNPRFELIDITNKTKKTPARMECCDVAVNDGGDWLWLEKYKEIKHLYHLVYDPQQYDCVAVELEWNVIQVVPSLEEYQEFGYIVQYDRGGWQSEGTRRIGPNEVEYVVLDRILYPDILLPTRNCSLTSSQSYEIIRKHVQIHLNRAAAEITSDYDFCFTVKKSIKLAKPYTTRYEHKKNNGRSYSPPRLKQTLHTIRTVEVFEMTKAEKPWQNYTPIPPFKGENLNALKANIDRYLDELMAYLNEPLVDCKCCGGAGVEPAAQTIEVNPN